MTNKVQKIKQEIERLKEHTAKCGYPGQGEFENGNREGRNWVCDKLLSFIDSLPEESGCEVNCTSNDDLEEAAKEYSFNIPTQLDADIVWKKETERHFKDGAKWQLNQMKETLQTEYEKGRFDMQQEMMKDAVDATIFSELKGSDGSVFQAKSDRFRMDGAKIGDRIKVIPIKTEQQ